MFVDKVKIYIKAGSGGDGHVSFHREKYVTNGGPDGGDGGNGGSIIFIAKDNMHTLLDFRFKKHFRAVNGTPGLPRNCRGKNAEDLIIEVPVGTVIKEADSGKVIADMHEANKEKVVLWGGRGGKGNARFATPTRQAPKFATPGVKTEEHAVVLELKTIADIGLVGFPNVGKSTLLSVVTRAKPKIANYHFTTLSPNIGILSVFGDSYAVADIPGLIEGAKDGVGLGHDFLRHIERTRMLLHVVDASGCEGRDPLEDYYTIKRELEEFNSTLASRPTIVVCNKMDLPDSQENFDRIKNELEGVTVIPISAATNSGIEELLKATHEMLQTLPSPTVFEEEEVLLDTRERDYTVEKKGDMFIVEGTMVEDIFSRVYPKDPDSMRYFQRLLIKTGIIDKLKKQGATDGSPVRMGGVEFDFVE